MGWENSMGLFECIRQKAVDLDRANLVDEDWGIAAKAMLEKRPVNFWLALVWLLEKLLWKMASKLPKIAPKTVINRKQTPVMVWLRDKLNAVYRDRTTPPPGLPTSDGESKFYEVNRFPNTQAARSRPSVSLPGGVHHKSSDNYYLDRDARRSVQPPKCVYIADSCGPVFKTINGETVSCEVATKVEAGLQKNFGLESPTPGFGYAWHRNKEEELPTPKYSKDLAALEKYDKFTYSD